MARSNRRRFILATLVVCLEIALCSVARTALGATVPLGSRVGDFSFVHFSDSHIPLTQSVQTITEIRNLGEVDLEPYGIRAPRPSFAIGTGDLTEFGGAAAGHKAWDSILALWNGCPFQLYPTVGNHDVTWDCLSPAVRTQQGNVRYSFDAGGCHFVIFDSPISQDPRPAFSEEKLRWLSEDLGKIDPRLPVILCMHHPPEGSEFASPTDLDRFFDVLDPVNVVAILTGHSHGFWRHVVNGYDVVCGGSTFTTDEQARPRGYCIGTIHGGSLKIAGKKFGEAKATMPLLDRPLAVQSRPRLRIQAPRPDQVVSGDRLAISTELEGATAREIRCLLDNANEVKLTASSGLFTGEALLNSLAPGRHSVNVISIAEDGTRYSRTVCFTLRRDSRVDVRWRTQLPAGVKAQPTIAGPQVLVGGLDGALYALKADDGSILWRVDTGGEIGGAPVVAKELAYFGSADGSFRAVDRSGQVRWIHAGKAAIYSTPVVVDDTVVFGDNAGAVHALDLLTGQSHWTFERAGYSIESELASDGQRIYFGSWDQQIWALDAKTGAIIWKCRGKGSEERPGAKSYYSPADCGPVVSGGRVFCADRDYKLSIIDSVGRLVSGTSDVVATGRSWDGQSVLIRRRDGLARMAPDGSLAWTTTTFMGNVPASPVETRTSIFACSSTGTLSALAPRSGEILWQYRATPDLYVLAPPAASDGVAIVAGLDGSVTCLSGR